MVVSATGAVAAAASCVPGTVVATGFVAEQPAPSIESVAKVARTFVDFFIEIIKGTKSQPPILTKLFTNWQVGRHLTLQLLDLLILSLQSKN